MLLSDEIRKKYKDGWIDADYFLPKVEELEQQNKELIECLIRVKKDFYGIDKACQLAGVHDYSLCKKDIEDTLEKIFNKSWEKIIKDK